MATPKGSLTKANHLFLKRDYQASIDQLHLLFSLLPPPASLPWALDLSPPERTTEKLRLQASSLFVTASTLCRKANTDSSSSISESFLKELMQSVHRSFQPPDTTAILPPPIVQTLALAGLSLSLPLSTIQSLIESYLFSLSHPTLVQVLSVSAEQEEEAPSEKERWWVSEARDGFQNLMEFYLVDILGEEGPMGRAEALRLLEWEERIGRSKKEVGSLPNHLSTL